MSQRRTVYVAQKGAVLRRRGQRLRVMVRRREVTEIRLEELERLVLVGNITLTPAALGMLADRGVDTVLLTHTGRYRGRIVGSASSNARLRMRQYELTRNSEASLEVARRIVRGKLANQRAFLLRHARRHGDDHALAVARSSIKAARIRAELAESLDSVRGCEGSGAAAYFRVFGGLLRNDSFRFTHRSRRPPLDPVNALLSLGYTLLHTVVEGTVRAVGLDPWLGTLHATLANRPSLACDLVEEFRTPIIDALVIAAINQGSFKLEDFEDAGPGEPVVLRPETCRWMVTLFERRMSRRTAYEPLGVRLSWRHVIEQQVRRYVRQVLGADEYASYRMR